MGILIGIFKVLFLLGFLIFIHEGGHFLVAKLCKIKVKEFSIGFGPCLFNKNTSETKYSLRAIPLGGYVDMLGENEEIDEEGSFSNAKISKRIAIVLAGAIVNIVFGILIYFLLMSTSGINSTTTIKEIIPEYSSQNTEFLPNDRIKKINNKKIRVKSDVDNILMMSNGEKLNVLVERDGQEVNFEFDPIKIEYNGMNRYILGVEIKRADKNLKNNIYFGFWETVNFLDSTKDSLVLLFSGNVGVEQMTGPVGISNMVVKTNGLYDFVYLMSVISLSLGVTNLLPIPALDGGKIVFLIIEAIRGKKMDEELELQIQSIGFSLLIILSLYVSFNDISKIF